MRPRPAAALRRLATGLPVLLLAAPASPQSPRVVAGTDVLVSRSAEPHAETALAVHPDEPGTLIAAGMVLGDDTGCTVYLSGDGGSTWKRSPLSDPPADGADPQVAFTPRGTAIAVCLGLGESDGRSVGLTYIWRSEDRGRSWQMPLQLGGSYDHPQIAVDPRTGAVYIAVMYGREYVAGLLRSDDDGRTFTGPLTVASGGSGIGQQVGAPLVLADGTLVFTYYRTSLLAKPGQAHSQTIWTAISRDGGRTFEPPRPGPQRRLRAGVPLSDFKFSSFFQTAVDRSDGPFRDRLYAAWTDFGDERARVRLTSSADRGETWSEPREVVPGLPAAAYSFQPTLAVSRDGTLGLGWFDTRAVADGSAYEVWFAASLDGGASFLPAVRLSSAPSRPLVLGNRRPSPAAWRHLRGTLRLNFTTAAGRFPQGGDYQGLAVDRDNRFRLAWADARNGYFQIWTAAARVERGAPAAATGTWIEAEVTGEVDAVLDIPLYEPEGQELLLPLRLRNAGTRPLRPPLRVRLAPSDTRYPELVDHLNPVLVGVDDGLAGIEIDYSCALDGRQELAPGEVTAARVWRFHLPDPDSVPDIQLQIFGRVLQELEDVGAPSP
jgi:hypothetical protein